MAPHKPALWGLGTEFREDEKKQPRTGATPIVMLGWTWRWHQQLFYHQLVEKNSYIAFPTYQVQWPEQFIGITYFNFIFLATL